MVGDLNGVRQLTIEVGERAGDDRAVAAPVASVDKGLEELGRARLRAEAGDRELLLGEDADAEAAGLQRSRARSSSSAPSETRTVGGSADTEANAVTVIPHGLSATQTVTSTTPLASVLMASTKSEHQRGLSRRIGDELESRWHRSLSSAASGWQPRCSEAANRCAVEVMQSPRPP